MTGSARGYDIAIVGMACRVPGARSLDAFWQNLRGGVESIVPLSDTALRAAGVPESLLRHPDYVRAAAPLEGMEDFDASFFGFNPREASILDPQHRHFLECAWEAMEHAGHRPDRMPGPVGVFAGSGHNAYLPYNLLTHPDLVDSVGLFLLRHTGNDKDFLTTRVSHLFDLRGPSVGVQTACSTSLVATHLACQSLLAGECDVALAGGVTIELPHRQGYLYKDGEIMSPDGHCRPFDVQAAGTVFGSGVGVVVLRRLTDALADGDRVWAVIRGSAVNNDGSLKAGYLAPSVDGQAQVIAEALTVADVPAETIGFVEAHGTGTPIGDPIEVAALSQAFALSPRQPTCALGSVKSNLGHLDTAAGVVGLIKAVLAMVHREIPPTLHFTAPNPACGLERSAFYVNADLRPWPSGATPRRAGVTSLGVGGTNAHVVLEEPPASVPGAPGLAFQPLFVSARSTAALDRSLERLADHLAKAAPDLADVGFTLARGRVTMPYRKAIVARDAAAAVTELRAAAGRPGRSPVTDRPPEVAFLFAGGGAQHPGMGAELLETEPVFRDAIEECLALLPRADAKRMLDALAAPPDQSEAAALLERPAFGLPALFAVQVASARLWSAWGVRPSAVIGHSMGEYTAAHLAGVLSLADAVRLVRFRGELFERLPAGAMLSVALDAASLSSRLEAGVSVAAANAPGLSVASGPVAAIGRLERRLAEEGIETTRLRIATAAHSAMLDPMLDEFRQVVARLEWSAPSVPIASNLSGTWLTPAEATSPDYWVRHLRHTVRFAEGIGQVLQRGDRILLEVGPGRTLASLARAHPACGAHRPVLTTLPHHSDHRGVREHLLRSAAMLWERGLPLDDADLFGPGRRRRVPLPTYPFARERHWVAPAEHQAPPRSVPATVDPRQVSLHTVAWERASGRERRTPERVILLHDGDSLAAAVGQALARVGAQVTDRPRAESPAAVAELVDTALRFGAPDAVIDLRTPKGGTALAEAGWAAETGLPLLRELVVRLTERLAGAPLELAVVTRDLESVGGTGTGPAAQAVTAAAAAVIAAEFPDITGRSVDVSPGQAGSWEEQQQARLIVEELGGSDPRVAIRDGQRWIPRFEPVELAAPELPLARAGQAFLITGGTGALGLALARELAAPGGMRLALVSRRPLPPREDWPDLLAEGGPLARPLRGVVELESMGAELLLLAADLGDPDQVRAAVDQARARFGRLTGVVHAAGRLRDRLLIEKHPEEIRRVIAPKLVGAVALDDALADSPPEWMVLYSSVSAVAGLPGQADYAGANAALDAFAARRARRRPGRTVSIGWSAWTDLGMTAVRSRLAGVRHQTVLDPARDWVLGEHRLSSGEAILPGTGFLNLAVTAAGLDDEGLELRDVTIRAPALVPDGATRTLISSVEDDGRLAIADRDQPGDELFTARVAPLPPPGQPRLDLDGLRARLDRAADAPSTAEASGAVRFGPRWRAARSVHLGEGEALIELALPEALAGDLERFPLHPGMLDVATAGAQALIPGWNETHPLFVPVSYGRVRVFSRLPARVTSHVVYRGDADSDGVMALFDVTLAAPDGTVVAEIAPLTLLRVDDPDQLRHPHATRPTASSRHPAPVVPPGSLSPDEGLRAFRQVMGGTASPQVLVTRGDPASALAALRAPPGTAGAAEPPPDVTPLVRALEAVPEIREAAVRAARNRGGEPLIAAFVVLQPDAHATVSELRRELRERLPGGPWPQAIVEVDALPRTASGEVDLQALPDPLGGAEPSAQGPRSPTEELVAGVWRDLLGVETIGVRDNFFDIGGHSLLSIRLISRLHQLTRVRLRHEDVVVNTLEQLAAKLEAGAQSAA